MTRAHELLKRVASHWAPPIRRSPAWWAEAKRRLSDKSPFPGPFRLSITPFLREVLEELGNPLTHEVDAQKSAQIGWTDGVLVNWVGHTIDEDPAPMMVLFPADKKGREFNAEKLEPAVEATPALAAKLVTKSRARENRQDYKEFAGGFLKLVGSNSPSNVKSTTAKNLAVEEPDDCNLNIKGQGDSITMLEERGKRYPGSKLLCGGTPSIAGVSAIAARMELTDKRRWLVPCHHCGEAAALEWGNVRWQKDPARNHPVYGDNVTESTRYVCSGCGGEWTDAERVANVKRGHWHATGEFRGKAGFYFNELMSVFPGSELGALVEKYLAAEHAKKTEGDFSKLIVFWNQTLGLPWEHAGTVTDAKELDARVEDYPEWFVPWGGLILTVGVDVQDDRLAVVVVAWGEGEESWLIWAGELYGNVLEQAVWDELDRTVVFRKYRHVGGADMAISAVSVDTSDGGTADAGYAYSRRANRKFGSARVMAIKGSSVEASEIFRAPKQLDVTSSHKAAKFGLRIYMVGVSRAKSLLLGAEQDSGRINLRDVNGQTGRGPGRMHWYRGVRADYFEQLTSEVYAPARDVKRGGNRLKKIWQRKAGKRNEFLDCTVYALHAARALRIDTYTNARWTVIREQLFQRSLFAPQPETAADQLQAADAVVEQQGAGAGGEVTVETVSSAQSAPVVPYKPAPPNASPRPNGRRMRNAGIQV